MLSALDDFDTNKITEMVIEIYDSGCILEDFSRFLFLALLKYQVSTDRELHLTKINKGVITKLAN